MNKRTSLQLQAINLQGLLDVAGDDVLMRTQLQSRLDSVRKKLQSEMQEPESVFPKENIVFPRAAFFLRGRAVQDFDGIRPSLAGEALIQYEKMYTEQAMHDERMAAAQSGRQRRHRGAPMPSLLFTGTPRGSFGFEFVPKIAEEETSLTVHAESLRHIAEAITFIGQSDQLPLADRIKNIPPRVLMPLKRFMKTLAEHDAELRFAFPDNQLFSLTSDQIKNASDRLQNEVSQETVEVIGAFRGLTMESGVFDLNPTTGGTITGHVADNLTEEDLIRIDALTNTICSAKLQKTTVRAVSGSESSSFVLMDAVPHTVALPSAINASVEP